MKKFMMMALAAVGALAITGCAQVQVSEGQNLSGQGIATSGTPVAHLTGNNSGLYFLSFPLITGSTTEVGSAAFGKDMANVPSVVQMVTEKSNALGAKKTLDITSQYSSTMIPIPFPFLFYYQSVNVSGNAVK
ncbi:hypothetical protein [Victivallis sp. Marseille-Q1083]|uniref:hypothetical protein n=1 Tax=Victivallis sp. Marseille-Q1083 TaxID=2717288 RepID=UPI00158DEFA4|nr:hypothetical protein [Victivallis sp. Marseille-Q1083]